MLSLIVFGLELCGEVPVEELLTLLTSCVAVSDNVLSVACSAVQYNDDSFRLPLTARIFSHLFCHPAIT